MGYFLKTDTTLTVLDWNKQGQKSSNRSVPNHVTVGLVTALRIKLQKAEADLFPLCHTSRFRPSWNKATVNININIQGVYKQVW